MRASISAAYMTSAGARSMPPPEPLELAAPFPSDSFFLAMANSLRFILQFGDVTNQLIDGFIGKRRQQSFELGGGFFGELDDEWGDPVPTPGGFGMLGEDSNQR